MQTLQVLLSIAGIAAYCGLAAFACFAFARLKRQENHILQMKIVLSKVLMLTMSAHLRNSFKEINQMNRYLQTLMEHENYEEAEKLKSLIANAEQEAMKGIEQFRRDFGEDSVDVKMTSIRRD